MYTWKLFLRARVLSGNLNVQRLHLDDGDPQITSFGSDQAVSVITINAVYDANRDSIGDDHCLFGGHKQPDTMQSSR